jgi:hypothetical protein
MSEAMVQSLSADAVAQQSVTISPESMPGDAVRDCGQCNGLAEIKERISAAGMLGFFCHVRGNRMGDLPRLPDEPSRAEIKAYSEAVKAAVEDMNLTKTVLVNGHTFSITAASIYQVGAGGIGHWFVWCREKGGVWYVYNDNATPQVVPQQQLRRVTARLIFVQRDPVAVPAGAGAVVHGVGDDEDDPEREAPPGEQGQNEALADRVSEIIDVDDEALVPEHAALEDQGAGLGPGHTSDCDVHGSDDEADVESSSGEESDASST